MTAHRPVQSRFKLCALLARVFVTAFLLVAVAPHRAHAQDAGTTELATFFSPEQLTALEQLVTLSESASPTVLEAQHILSVAGIVTLTLSEEAEYRLRT